MSIVPKFLSIVCLLFCRFSQLSNFSHTFFKIFPIFLNFLQIFSTFPPTSTVFSLYYPRIFLTFSADISDIIIHILSQFSFVCLLNFCLRSITPFSKLSFFSKFFSGMSYFLNFFVHFQIVLFFIKIFLISFETFHNFCQFFVFCNCRLNFHSNLSSTSLKILQIFLKFSSYNSNRT